jgi:hypothetical protein
VKDTRLRRNLNVLDQIRTRERSMYTPGAPGSASESPRARAPEKNEQIKTLTARRSLLELARHAPEKMISKTKRETRQETINRTPILMGMGVMLSALQRGEKWGEGGGVGGESEWWEVNGDTMSPGKKAKKAKIKTEMKHHSSSPTRLSVSSKIVQVQVCFNN